jgi:hypothetical protein
LDFGFWIARKLGCEALINPLSPELKVQNRKSKIKTWTYSNAFCGLIRAPWPGQ